LIIQAVKNLRGVVMKNKEQCKKENQFLSLKEACDYLKLKPATLYAYNNKRIIPFYRRRSRKVFYRKDDLDNFILRNTNLVKSAQQIETEAITNIVTGK
jgi:hypothetical protein